MKLELHNKITILQKNSGSLLKSYTDKQVVGLHPGKYQIFIGDNYYDNRNIDWKNLSIQQSVILLLIHIRSIL